MTTAPNIEMIASSLRHCSLTGGAGGSGRRRGGGTRRREGGDDSDGVTVELNSEVALPYHWEQCLDIRTGQVYYINWEDGTRTTVDPRTASAAFSSPTPRSTSSASRRTRRASTPSSEYTSVSSVGADVTTGAWRGNDSGYDNDDEEEDDGEAEDHDDDEEEEEEEDELDAESSSSSTTTSSSSSTGSSRGSAVSSTLSSFSPTDESGSGDNGGRGLGAAGHVLVAAGCRACFMYFMVPKRADVCPKCGSSGLLHLSRNGYA
ncbi:uncharacterized protein DDB_G0271670 [Sorghum bicolor]|uniref:WW domain-containing protein n=1 Tax=Sorghum bicolor TaxID=4558 RepID=C5XT79_SORBI|nr:uncharacterized protein DDB_G0271670 [Sorghum bicolor]EES05143.1 hypothetical protein SORBI_3004G158000 [Sorghum bicolor]|eukprot:XP_002452167.1 uncharacterized protein DDB_G0271670 [Sorghum bicolor]